MQRGEEQHCDLYIVVYVSSGGRVWELGQTHIGMLTLLQADLEVWDMEVLSEHCTPVAALTVSVCAMQLLQHLSNPHWLPHKPRCLLPSSSRSFSAQSVWSSPELLWRLLADTTAYYTAFRLHLLPSPQAVAAGCAVEVEGGCAPPWQHQSDPVHTASTGCEWRVVGLSEEWLREGWLLLLLEGLEEDGGVVELAQGAVEGAVAGGRGELTAVLD